MHGGKTIVPAANLVSNLGFRPDDSEADLPTSLATTLIDFNGGGTGSFTLAIARGR